MHTPLIIIGAGGHAKVLLDCLKQSPVDILGIVEKYPDKCLPGTKYLGNDAVIEQYGPHEVQLVNALGPTDVPLHRLAVFNRFKANGYRFYSVLSSQRLYCQ